MLSQKIIIATAILFNISRMWRDDGLDDDDDDREHDDDEAGASSCGGQRSCFSKGQGPGGKRKTEG